jgi:hypothetical protein
MTKVTEKPNPLEKRKKLSFEQAEGIAPLPSQLKQQEISNEFRAILWAELHQRFKDDEIPDSFGSTLGMPWRRILCDLHVFREHQPVDEFSEAFDDAVGRAKGIVFKGQWSAVLGWLEFVLKHPACPDDLAAKIDAIMRHCRLAYGIFDEQVISPIGSAAERANIERAFADLAAKEFHGARAHLRNAAEALTQGKTADSIRESIHTVESVVTVLEPSGDFGKALARLEGKTRIHGALKKGFTSIYGFTSDESGLRHALLDAPASAVDETDALFMIGACAAFVSYLINKARAAKII